MHYWFFILYFELVFIYIVRVLLYGTTTNKTGNPLSVWWEFLQAMEVVHLDFRISLRIFKKFDTVLMEYSGTRRKLIHEKTISKNLVTLSL